MERCKVTARHHGKVPTDAVHGSTASYRRCTIEQLVYFRKLTRLQRSTSHDVLGPVDSHLSFCRIPPQPESKTILIQVA
jgi:hypothetical protein